MKRILLLLAAGSLALSAQTASTSIVGSLHDLSATGTQKMTDYTQVCKFCHSPHGAAPASAQVVPLWGHKTSVATYTMYNSTNNPNSMLNGTAVVDTAPNGPSMACMSCHDGTVAVNARMAGGYSYSYGNVMSTATNAGDFNIAPETSGTKTYQMGYLIKHTVGALTGSNVDMTTVHPISITYVGTAAELWATPKNNIPLFKNQVQCASCHDVHKWSFDGTTTLFLRDTTTGSQLCLDCHNK